MNAQTVTDDQPAAAEGGWKKPGIADWEFCWIGVGLIWLFSPLWLKITLPCFAVLLVVRRAETSHSPSPRWARYCEVAMAMATGKVARVAGRVFAVLTVSVVYLAYLAITFVALSSPERRRSWTPWGNGVWDDEYGCMVDGPGGNPLWIKNLFTHND